MAEKAKIRTLRRKSRVAARKGLQSRPGLPVPPRKAMSLAGKKSKGLPYPLPPYPGANPLQLVRWASGEWQALGRFKRLALPVIAFVALTTWEKERERQEVRWDEIERQETVKLANDLYIRASTSPRQRKGRRSIWPFKRKGQ
jgi:hypothetical protein